MELSLDDQVMMVNINEKMHELVQELPPGTGFMIFAFRDWDNKEKGTKPMMVSNIEEDEIEHVLTQLTSRYPDSEASTVGDLLKEHSFV